MLNTVSRSLIIWEPAIETWAQEMNGGPGNELGAQRAEQFPHLGNYALTPASMHSTLGHIVTVQATSVIIRRCWRMRRPRRDITDPSGWRWAGQRQQHSQRRRRTAEAERRPRDSTRTHRFRLRPRHSAASTRCPPRAHAQRRSIAAQRSRCDMTSRRRAQCMPGRRR